MKIAICDDNKTQVDEVKHIIEDYFCISSIDFEIDSYCNSLEIYTCAKAYNIAFLDIEMDPFSGIDIAKKLKEINPHIIIFIMTSYNKYLDDAMDLNVFRYIQKPLNPERVKTGLKKALACIDDNIITFYLKNGKVTKSLSSSDIVYIETVNRSTQIVTTNNTFFSDNKIDFWKEKLVATFFFKVHKSFIINMNYITEYQRDSVVLLKKHTIPIAYRKQAEFRKVFLNYIGGR